MSKWKLYLHKASVEELEKLSDKQLEALFSQSPSPEDMHKTKR